MSNDAIFSSVFPGSPASAGNITLADLLVFDGDYTGTNDMLMTLHATMDANPNSTIQLLSGTIKLSANINPAVGTSILLNGSGAKSTIIKFPWDSPAIYTSNAMLYQRNNSVQQTVTSITLETADDSNAFTTNTDQTHVLNVSDESAFKPGMWVALTASDQHPVTAEHIRMGQAKKVWGTVAGKIFLAGKLDIDPATYLTTNVKVNQLLEAIKCEISNIGFTADGQWDSEAIDSPAGLHSHCLTIYGIPHAKVRDCEFNKIWEGAVIFDFCPGSQAYGNISRNLVNLHTAAESLGSNPLTSNGTSTINVHHVGHKFVTGSSVDISGATGQGNVTANMINDVHTVIVIDADHYTFTVGVTADSSTTFGGSSVVDRNGRLGYHYGVGPMCDGTVIEDNTGEEGRHFGTAIHHTVSSYSASNWYQMGCSCNVTVQNNIIINTFAIPCDEHESAVNWTYKGNQIFWSGKGPQGGSYVGYWFQGRGANSKLIGNRQFGGQYGIRVPANERLAGSIMKIEQQYSEHLYSSTDVLPTTGASTLQGFSTRNSAIIVDNHHGITNTPTLMINGFETEDCNQSIVMLGGIVKAYAKGLWFKKPGVPIEVLGDSELWILDQAVFDYRGTTRTPTYFNCAALWSLYQDKTTASAGAKVVFLQKPIIIKDSSLKPKALFDESDVTATKTYYAPGITQVNIGAVADTLLKYNSGAAAATTTMSESTEVSTISGKDQPLDATLTALAAFNTNGLLVQTAADTFVGRTLGGTTNRITVTNGDGVSGAPVVDIASNYVGQNTITTLGTITTGVWTGTTIAVTAGGSGLATATKGDIRVGSGVNTIAALGVGADGTIIVADANSSNGLAYFDALHRPNVISGQFIHTPIFAAVTTKNLVAGTIYFAPIWVKKRTTFTDIGFATAVVTAGSYKLGIYADGGGKPTSTVITNSTVTVGPFTTAAATAQAGTLGTPVPLNPGWYWLAILPDTTGTVNSASSGTGNIIGLADLSSATGALCSFVATYAGGLPDMTSNTMTRTAANGTPFMGLKVQ